VGLVEKTSAGNQVQYKADRRTPIFKELATLLKKTFGLVDVLRDALRDLEGRIEVAAVFGSIARGEERRDSDVDLLVVGDVDFTELVLALHAAQQILGREINPVIHSREGFNESLASGDRFLRSVVDDPLIFVIGGADDLG
jgi:predicted nucleotidyltransferase